MRKIFPIHAAAITEFMGALSAEESEALGEWCRKLGEQDFRPGPR